jgi:tetratricopeptide (TPR) repeat protein
MIPSLAALLWLALAIPLAADESLTFRGPSFSLNYPKKDTKLLPASGVAVFSLEYRKKSRFQLNVESLLQPIDLSDRQMAEIFLEVHSERLSKERGNTIQIVSKRLQNYPWGTGVEFIYYQSPSGKGDPLKVVEVLTTAANALYRLSYSVPQKELAKSEPPLRDIIGSFRPSTAAATSATGTAGPASAPADPLEQARAAYRRFSASGVAEAVASYRRAAAAPGVGAEAFSGLAQALGWKGYLEDGLSAAELSELTRAAERARSLAPRSKETLRGLAYAAYHANRMVDMEKHLSEALAIDAADAESYLLQALWYNFNPKKARELADEALRRDPRLVGALLVKGLAARKDGDPLGATSAFRQALSLEPTLLEAHFALGEMAEERDNWAEALDAYRAAVVALPSSVDARFRLAMALRKAERPDEAIAEYQNALRLDPNVAEVHYNLAVVYLQEKGDEGKAAEHFQRFLTLDPQNERAAQVQSWLRARGYR